MYSKTCNYTISQCGLFFKFHLRHAKWGGFLLSLQWVWIDSGFWESYWKIDDALLEKEVLDSDEYF